MLTGQPPFKGENEFILRDAKLFEDPVPPSRLNKDISGDLDRLILKAIGKDPLRRFSSVAEMKSELLKVAGKQGRPGKGPAAETAAAFPEGPAAERDSAQGRVSASASPRRKRPSEKRGRGGRIVGAAAGIVVIAAAAIFGIRMLSGGDDGTVTVPARDSVATRLPARADTRRVVESAVPEPGGSPEEPGRNTPVVGAPLDKAAEEKKTGAAATGAAGAKPSRPAQLAPGFLKVLSRPKNSSIYINGELQYEKTPFTFDRPPGQYTVRIVRMAGGTELEYSKTVALESGETEIVSHNFEE